LAVGRGGRGLRETFFLSGVLVRAFLNGLLPSALLLLVVPSSLSTTFGLTLGRGGRGLKVQGGPNFFLSGVLVRAFLNGLLPSALLLLVVPSSLSTTFAKAQCQSDLAEHS
jgi:hypothetical protein